MFKQSTQVNNALVQHIIHKATYAFLVFFLISCVCGSF